MALLRFFLVIKVFPEDFVPEEAAARRFLAMLLENFPSFLSPWRITHDSI